MQEIEETMFYCIDYLTEKDIVESNLYYEMEYEEKPLIMKAENDIFISEMIMSEECIRVSYKENNMFLYWINENERKETNTIKIEEYNKLYNRIKREQKLERICNDSSL